MSKISLEPNDSGAGTFSIVSPDSNINRTLDLPDGDGTLLIDSSTIDSNNLQSDIYKQSNIIGTVSESGGVPTGAIIERGSNSNGKYIKLADGTQMCWANPYEWEGEFGRLETWTYPVSFSGDSPTLVGAPATRATASSDAENTQFGGSGNYSAGLTSATIFHQSTRGVDFASTLFAIGRWY